MSMRMLLFTFGACQDSVFPLGPNFHRYTNRPARRTFSNWFVLNFEPERGEAPTRSPASAKDPDATAECGTQTNPFRRHETIRNRGFGLWMLCPVCQIHGVPFLRLIRGYCNFLPPRIDNNLFFARCSHLNVFAYCLSLAGNLLHRTSEFLLAGFVGGWQARWLAWYTFFNHLKMYASFFFDTCVSKCGVKAKG